MAEATDLLRLLGVSPGTRSAIMDKLLAGGMPSSAGMLDEGWLSSLSRGSATQLPLDPIRAQAAVREMAASQEQDAQAAMQRQAGQFGPAAEQQRQTLALRQALGEAANPLRRQGGGGRNMSGEQQTIPPPALPTPPKILQETRYPSQAPPQPKPPAPNQELGALRDALAAYRSREREQGELRSRIQAHMGPNTSFLAGTESLFSDTEKARMRSKGTPEQEFHAAYQAARERRNLVPIMNLATPDLAQRAITNWQSGDTEAVQRDIAALMGRRSSMSKAKAAPTRRAVLAREDRLYDRAASEVDLTSALGINPAQYGLTATQVLRAYMTPQQVSELLADLKAGRSLDDLMAQAQANRLMQAVQGGQTAQRAAPTQMEAAPEPKNWVQKRAEWGDRANDPEGW